MESNLNEQQPLVSSESTEMESHVDDEQQPLISSVETTEREMVDEQDSVETERDMVDEQQLLVSSFHEFVPGQSDQIAKECLQASDWNVEDAVQLFYYSQEVRDETERNISQAEMENPVNEQQSLVSSVETEREMVDEQQPLVSSVETVSDEQQLLVSSFLEIVAGQSDQIARQFLQASNWNVQDAVALFYGSHDVHDGAEWNSEDDEMESLDGTEGDNSELDTLYRPPLELICKTEKGLFREVVDVAKEQNKWLIVNVQSKREFSCNTLNLDTWAHEAVSQTIAANFIFWQVYDDANEGQKVCTFYKLTSFPAILVLDPTTGQKMKLWGMKEATQLLEDLDPFMDAGPEGHQTTKKDEDHDMTATVAPSCTDTDELMTDEPSTSKKLTIIYPDLPEEPEVDKTLLCRIGVRLPDGHRLQRKFLKTDPVQLLWSYCSSHLDEAESRPFHLTEAIPGASHTLDYECKQTFEDSGLSNSMISVTWD